MGSSESHQSHTAAGRRNYLSASAEGSVDQIYVRGGKDA